MSKKSSSPGGVVFRVLNLGFTVVMFCLPTACLAYWYFYIRDPTPVVVPEQVVIQERSARMRDPVLTGPRSSRRPSVYVQDMGESQGAFSESPNGTRQNESRSGMNGSENNEPQRSVPVRDVHQIRTWKDASGSFSVEAKFYSAVGDQVKLIKKDGNKIEVPISKLGEDDKEYLRDFFKTKGIYKDF